MNEIFLKEQNQISRRFCILDDDGKSCWFYLTEPDDGKYVADAFAYNRIDPIPKSQIKEYREGPPPICKTHASINAQIENPYPNQFIFIWSTDGESVALLKGNNPIAMIIDAKKYGYSKGIAVSGPWGHPWNQAIYDKNFAEPASSQDADKLRL